MLISSTDDDMKRGERKPFEPTPIELRKQYNTLDSIIRARSGQLKREAAEAQNTADDSDEEGFLPPYNSAF